MDIKELVGKTLISVENIDDEEIIFKTDRGEEFKMLHHQDCCEIVRVEEVCGNFVDLVGSPILIASEVKHTGETPPGVKVPEYQDESFTWTFYNLATIKGSVAIRWYGGSNGYYSESVDFYRVGA